MWDLAAALGQFGPSSSNTELVHYVYTQGAIVLLQGCWVIGHLLGYLVIGASLIRSRAIPLWAASLFILGVPFQGAGYGAHQSVLQLLCFALIFIGSIPAALALLRQRKAEAPAPQDEVLAPAL